MPVSLKALTAEGRWGTKQKVKEHLSETNGKFQFRDKQKMIICFSFLFVSKLLFSVCLLT